MVGVGASDNVKMRTSLRKHSTVRREHVSTQDTGRDSRSDAHATERDTRSDGRNTEHDTRSDERTIESDYRSTESLYSHAMLRRKAGLYLMAAKGLLNKVLQNNCNDHFVQLI